jgi:hypothetical protein
MRREIRISEIRSYTLSAKKQMAIRSVPILSARLGRWKSCHPLTGFARKSTLKSRLSVYSEGRRLDLTV